MHTKADWIRAICENPYDTTLRLVYADWLDEQELHPLQAKAIRADLFATSDAAGNDPLMQLLGGHNWHRFGLTRWEARAGFIHRIDMRCPDFVRHAETVFREQPVTEVRLIDQIPINRGLTFDWEKYGSDLAGEFLIPDVLFVILPGASETDWVWSATSRELADRCLSEACVRYGRESAGLPKLVAPERV